MVRVRVRASPPSAPRPGRRRRPGACLRPSRPRRACSPSSLRREGRDAARSRERTSSGSGELGDPIACACRRVVGEQAAPSESFRASGDPLAWSPTSGRAERGWRRGRERGRVARSWRSRMAFARTVSFKTSRCIHDHTPNLSTLSPYPRGVPAVGVLSLLPLSARRVRPRAVALCLLVHHTPGLATRWHVLAGASADTLEDLVSQHVSSACAAANPV